MTCFWGEKISNNNAGTYWLLLKSADEMVHITKIMSQTCIDYYYFANKSN